LSDPFIAERRGHLDPRRAQERVDPGPLLTASETIYLTAADSVGNMVSLINSNYDAFGSGIVVPGTGFPLHNRGAGFTLTPGRPNTAGPGKRPFHTLIPGFVTRSDGTREQPYMSFGLMGGSMQAQGHVQFLLNFLLFGMDLQQAIDAPRFRHFEGQQVAIEAPVADSVRATLTALGHALLDEQSVSFGGAQAIVRLRRGYAAGSDPGGQVGGRPAVVSSVLGGNGTIAWEPAPGVVAYVGYSGGSLDDRAVAALRRLAERSRPLDDRQWRAVRPQRVDQANELG